MEKSKGGTKHKKPSSKSSGEYRDTARQLMSVESAVDDLNREAVRHEHRGLVARQGARDLLEEGKRKEARTLIEKMLSERNYVVACGVTSRRIKRLTEAIKDSAKKAGGVTKRVARSIGDVELALKGSVLAEIEEALNVLESALNPQLEPASSVIELVSTVKVVDVDQLQRELEGEIAVLSNLSLGKNMSKSGTSRFSVRKYKLEKTLDRGDTKNNIGSNRRGTDTEEETGTEQEPEEEAEEEEVSEDEDEEDEISEEGEDYEGSETDAESRDSTD